MLLFVPNLSNQKDAVREKGNKAVVKVVESQLLLYELKAGEKPSIEQLVKAGYITGDQAETYRKTKQGRCSSCYDHGILVDFGHNVFYRHECVGFAKRSFLKCGRNLVLFIV